MGGGAVMRRREERKKQLTLDWKQEHKILTLEGEPVLEYRLFWPELNQAGLGGRWINRYYAHLAKSWRLRWQREIYWKACLDLAARRSQSKPFTPWSGALSGEVTCWERGVLSIRMEGEETRGDGKANRVCWGDVWNVREGAPLSPRDVLEGDRTWKRQAMEQIVQQGRQRSQNGECFLDPDWEEKILRQFPKHDLYRTEAGVEVAFPQGSIAPAVEGTPHFLLQQKTSLCQNRDAEEKNKNWSK